MQDIVIPDRPAFKASEVCEIARVQLYGDAEPVAATAASHMDRMLADKDVAAETAEAKDKAERQSSAAVGEV